MKEKIIGCTSFLNVKPLLGPLQEKLMGNGYKIVLKTPEKLSQMLMEGETDISLIPSIDFFKCPEFYLLPSISISSFGKVKSVILFSKVPLENIRAILLDRRSRTSVSLLKILLEVYYGIHPRYISNGSSNTTSEETIDARLVIGDEALQETLALDKNGDENALFSLDLGEAWMNFTGLPFVFAVFATRKKQLISEISHLLLQAKSEGISQIEEIARNEAKRLGLQTKQCIRYLKDNIHYDLGIVELQALIAFQSLALGMGLVEKTRALSF